MPATEATRLLEISSLPGGQIYTVGEHIEFDLEKFFEEKIRPVIELKMQLGLLAQNDSFGFAMAWRSVHTTRSTWDEPEALVFMTYGWGPNKERYIANAVRKIRFAAREGLDSIEAVTYPHLVDTPVETVESDGTYRWGDFAKGGAAWLRPSRLNGLTYLGACSAYTQEEDHVETIDSLWQVVLQVYKLQQQA